MQLQWTKLGELCDRVYTAAGVRGSYRIDLDQVADRWVIHVNGSVYVNDVYYITNAKRIAQVFEDSGIFRLPPDLRPRPDGGSPRFLVGPAVDSPPVTPSMPSTPSAPPRAVSPPLATPTECSAVDRLVALVQALGIEADNSATEWAPWQSGVYALVDCVFSAQAKYETMVRPMLLNRLPQRPGLQDRPGLAFSAFLADVDSFGLEKIEAYSSQVLNRQMVGGRRKTEVCYDGARFFVRRGFETASDLQALGTDQLGNLVLVDFQGEIRGVGPALARYLLMLLGDEDHIKPDVMINRFWGRLGVGPADPETMRSVFQAAARNLGTTAARLDHAVWRFEGSA